MRFNMNREDVLPGVISAIKTARDSEADFQINDSLVDDLKMDSLGFVELCTGLEDTFNIDVDESVYNKLKTVEDVIELVMNSPQYEDA